MYTKEDIKLQSKIATITTNSIAEQNKVSTSTREIIVKFDVDNKSIIKVGNIKLYNTKKFNWFQKKMIKLIFGFEVNDLESQV